MLRQSIPPPHQQPLESSSSSDKDDLNISRALLLDIIQENHLLYHMEKRDRPNNIIRVLVELHQLGGNIYRCFFLTFFYIKKGTNYVYYSHSGTVVFSVSLY